MTKYNIYIETLKGNKLDLCACHVKIKHALEKELNICKKNKILEKFENMCVSFPPTPSQLLARVSH